MTRTPLPPETSIGRVALRVGDLDRLVDFYESVVGLTVLDRGTDRAVLGVDGTPLLELRHAPDAPAREQSAAGLFHTAVRVPTRSALGAALERVDARWQLTGTADHGVSEALYLQDPEDNGVEIYRDRPREEWPTSDGRVQMGTRALALDALHEAAGDDAEGVPAGTDLGHVHLEVTDLQAAREFYVDTLGLTVRDEWDGGLFVAAGDYHHHLGLNTWNRRSTPASGRTIAWFELRVPDHALAEARDRLAEAGIEISDTDDGIAVEDQDGIGLWLRAR